MSGTTSKLDHDAETGAAAPEQGIPNQEPSQQQEQAHHALSRRSPHEASSSMSAHHHKRTFLSQGLVFIEQCIEGLSHEELGNAMRATPTSLKQELDALEPPLSRGERRRDRLLETMANNRWILYANVLVLFLVVASGAIWFFFILGWQTLCSEPSRTDCEPRNTIYNIAIHILTGLFTWMCSVAMPWRWAHTLHSLGISCPHRSNEPGFDLYGLPSDDPWFHVPRNKRLVILFFLMFNCFFQYANQVARGIYWSYDDSSSFPGNLLTTLFFVLSLIWAVVGALLFWKHTSIVRQTDKERFGPGPIEMVKEMYEAYRNKDEKPTEEEANRETDDANATRETDVETSMDVETGEDATAEELPDLEKAQPHLATT